MPRPSRSSSCPSSASRTRKVQAYLDFSHKPLQALIALAPLLLAYELGALLYATRYHQIIQQGSVVVEQSITQHVTARLWLLSFFEWLGITGFFLPGLIVSASLIGWHLYRKDPWQWSPKTYLLMYSESVLWAIPLFVFALVLTPKPAWALSSWLSTTLAYAYPSHTPWQAEVVFSLGAGIYEELLFRLLAMTIIHAFFFDYLKLPDSTSSLLAMVLSSLAFAFYHFSAANPFSWSLLAFYSAAGFYLACIYILRGIGLAAGSHAFYDLFVVAWHLLRP